MQRTVSNQELMRYICYKARMALELSGVRLLYNE